MTTPRLRVLALPGERFGLIFDRNVEALASIPEILTSIKERSGAEFILAFTYEVDLGDDT